MAEAKKNIKGRIASLNIYHTDAYAIAVRNGYKGTEAEWLASIAKDASKIAREESADIYKEATDAVKELYAKCDKAEGDAKAVIASATNTAVASVESSEGAALTAIAEAKATMLEEIEVAGDIVQTTGCSETSVMSQGASSRSFANAIKGEESGGAVLCEDVSPVLHPVVVEIRSKNVLPETSVVIGKYWEINANGVVYQVNNPDLMCATEPLLVEPNNTYYVSSKQDDTVIAWAVWFVDENYKALGRTEGWQGTGGTFTVPSNCRYALFTALYNKESYQNNIMINEGSTAEPYTPFAPNGTAVKVTSAGANLFDKSKVANATQTKTGFSFTNTGASGTPYVIGALKTVAPNLRVGDTVTFYADCVNALYASGFFYLDGSQTDWHAGDFHTISQADLDSSVYAYGVGGAVCEYNKVIFTLFADIPYEPYKAGQTIDTTVGSTIDLPSIAPYMSVYTDTEGTAVDVTYVKDTNAVVQKLVNAIVALGGNV